MALEADEHPFTAFNKGDGLVGAPTLVGNWQEERALQELTSVTRYEVRCPPSRAGHVRPCARQPTV